MVIENAKDNFIFKKKIEWTNAEDGSVDFVEMREFNMQEQITFQSKAKVNGEVDEVGTLKVADTLFKDCIVSSSIVHADGTPATKQEVYDILKKNSSLFLSILEEWLGREDNNSPFFSMNKTNKK